MDTKPTIKALTAALVLLIFAVVVILGVQRNHRRAEEAGSEPYSDESTQGDNFITEADTAPYEAYTEPQSEAETETETTTEKQTERTTEAPKEEPAKPEPEYFDEEAEEENAGDYIGYFELTAYEWTGEPMANGEYPYYGAVACNSLALGTRIYIEGYGTFQVCDRGGMGNNVIDIYLGDPYVCEQFGRRGADVYYAD